ncbi:MAG: hypothetical protein JSR58_00385 [Verrucomicrobia bacterium]|nr:hypothetical protein [Verrucomicrobiota bacterium]
MDKNIFIPFPKLDDVCRVLRTKYYQRKNMAIKLRAVDGLLIDSLTEIGKLQPGCRTELVPGYGMRAAGEITVPAYCADVTARVSKLSKSLATQSKPSLETVQRAQKLIHEIKKQIVACDFHKNPAPQPIYKALDELTALSKQIGMDLQKPPVGHIIFCIRGAQKISHTIVPDSKIREELPESFTCLTQKGRPIEIAATDWLIELMIQNVKELPLIQLPESFLRKNMSLSSINLELGGSPIHVQFDANWLKEMLDAAKVHMLNSAAVSLLSVDEDPHGVRQAYQLLPGEFQFQIRQNTLRKETGAFFPFPGSTKALVRIENKKAQTPMVFDRNDSYSVQKRKWEEHLQAQEQKADTKFRENDVKNAEYEVVACLNDVGNIIENKLGIVVALPGNSSTSFPFIKVLVRKELIVIGLNRTEQFHDHQRPTEKKCAYFAWAPYFPELTHIQVAKLFEKAQVSIDAGLLEIQVPTKE